MRIEQTSWTGAGGWNPSEPGRTCPNADLVLLFGSPALLKNAPLLDTVKRAYPRAHHLGCSTAGEICGIRVFDDSLIATAVQLEHGHIQGARTTISEGGNSFDVGTHLAKALDPSGLIHVFVLSDGLRINGSDLVRGLTSGLPKGVTLTGGLSGDGARFEETFVLWDSPPERNVIAVLGFYGPGLRIGFGSLGGWDPFGPERLITKSSGNVLYQLDGRSALELYKQYLGEHACGLPATGLLFPLSLRASEGSTPVVRTILSISESEQSLTFAGDVPVGSYARLMRANFDRLIDGAVGAAKTSYDAIGSSSPDLAILISCVGRKLVLKQRIEEEVEGVRDIFGEKTILTGFYSYGEISPFTPSAKCELHNQTMTITTISEEL